MVWSPGAWRWYCRYCPDKEFYTAPTNHVWYVHGVIERMKIGTDSRVKVAVRAERPKVVTR